MALISSEPQTIGDMAARVAALEDKYVVVIDNTAYHSMTADEKTAMYNYCLLYTSPSPRDGIGSRMPSSA